VQAIGAGTGVTANADVVTPTGNITILAAQNVTFTAGADIQTAGAGSTGTIDVVAGSVGNAGSINLSTTSNTTSTSGDIRFWAETDINVGGLISTAANVSLTADTGTIYDNDNENVTVDIAATGLRLWAGTGVGVLGAGVNPLETTVTTVSAARPRRHQPPRDRRP